MILKINGTEYEAKFGIGFVRELDKKYNVSFIAGQRMGYGLEAVIPLVLAGSAVALSELLYAGTCTCPVRPTEKEVDDFIDDLENYDKFVEQVIDGLKKQNATKKKVAELEENYKKAEAEKKAEKEAQNNPANQTANFEPKMPITKG